MTQYGIEMIAANRRGRAKTQDGQVVESIAVIAAVADRHDLGAFATARWTDFRAPFFAEGDPTDVLVEAARLSGQLFSEVRAAERPCAKYQL